MNPLQGGQRRGNLLCKRVAVQQRDAALIQFHRILNFLRAKRRSHRIRRNNKHKIIRIGNAIADFSGKILALGNAFLVKPSDFAIGLQLRIQAPSKPGIFARIGNEHLRLCLALVGQTGADEIPLQGQRGMGYAVFAMRQPGFGII